MPSRVTAATLKRLLTLSGNRCAFPKCPQPLIDPGSNKFIGHICHIRAASRNGPRFDETQSDEERHGYGNLLMLCPVHHTVVDADVAAYPVARLEAMKAEREKAASVGSPLDASILDAAIASLTDVSVQGGSVIISQGQLGGQVAHSITNIGPVARHLSPAALAKIAAELGVLSPPPIERLAVPHGDGEALAFANEIGVLLGTSGWPRPEIVSAVYGVPQNGIIAKTPTKDPSLLALLEALSNVGFRCSTRLDPKDLSMRLVIGTNA